MIFTTRAVVLKTIQYAETSVIASIFTEELGLRSYLIKGVRSPKNTAKQNLLQPLSLLEMTVYENPKKEIQSVKEIKPDKAFGTIPFDFTKISVVFFLNEVLYKTIKESVQNKPLFHFIYSSLFALDEYPVCPGHFHLDFMLKLSHYLGFEPFDNYSPDRLPYFDLKEGCFHSEYKDPLMTLDTEASRMFHQILRGGVLEELNRSRRNYLQEILLKYYEIHLDGFRNVYSHIVLKDILR